ncbi:MAG: hypothetical protein KDA68_08140, partial [Planctomycetaceae bacterium]|nr:hypothetical protein [Planctomycetaceae bacterium]
MEDRTLLSGQSLFELIDPKLNECFELQQDVVQQIYGSNAATQFQSVWSNAYSSAVSSGPLANQLTGEGATLSSAFQDYTSQWFASDSLALEDQPPGFLEIALKDLGRATAGSLNETISSPSTWFNVGMAAGCWVGNFSFAVLTPWCIALTANALKGFAKDAAINFAVIEGDQLIDHLDWNPSTKQNLHALVDLVDSGHDLFGLSRSLLDAHAGLSAPDILEKAYTSANASVDFVDYWLDQSPILTDLFRTSDPITQGLAESTLACNAVRYQGHLLGEATLSISNERTITADERKALQSLFGNAQVTTDFFGFSQTQTQELFQLMGTINGSVRLQDGQILILGTDGPDTIDVYSSVDVTGNIEVTVNGQPTVIFTRTVAPNGVAVYARGGDDQVSIRCDLPSYVSGGAGNDNLTGGWNSDIIHGGPGNDVILGREGDDLLRGDWGDDEIRGGAGNNVLSGGPGTNIVIDNHQLVSFGSVSTALELAAAPSGSIPILMNINATPNPVSLDATLTISAVGADGNGGSIDRFEVWAFGVAGDLLAADVTAADGLSVETDASQLGGVGTHKIIARIIGTNGLASNWVSRDIIVEEPASQVPVIENILRNPSPVTQGQTLTLEAVLDDPDNLVNSVQFIRDVDGSDTFTTGDSILGNGVRTSGNHWVIDVDITAGYSVGTNRFLARARYDNNTKWTDVVARAVEVNPPAGSEPYIVSLTPSATILQRGGTPLTLTAEGVGGPNGVTEVRFYYDSNGNGTLEPNEEEGDDLFLGNDSDGSNGWTKRFGISSYPLGTNLFFAQPEDMIQRGNYVQVEVQIIGIDTEPPTATLTEAPDVTSAGGNSYALTVTYSDNVVLKTDTFSEEDSTAQIRVFKDDESISFIQTATFVSVDLPGDGPVRAVTYQITPPDGSWDFADNGEYVVRVLPNNEISDYNGNNLAVGELGRFHVTISDPTPPIVDLQNLSTNPDAPSVVTTQNFTVMGSASDPESGVDENNYHFFLSAFESGIWSEPVDLGAGGNMLFLGPLQDGLYSITLQAQNNAGLTATSPAGYFFIDTMPLAPVLDPDGFPYLNSLTQNISDVDNFGTLVSDIIARMAPDGGISDPNPGDLLGIAINGLSGTSSGTWEFSIN